MSNIEEKLKKIKELAERGVGGEREQAERIYNKLIKKYEGNIKDIKSSLKVVWFPYRNEIDSKLLSQIIYKVTGSINYLAPTDTKNKVLGIECTEFERDEIQFYYEFYTIHLERELSEFLGVFYNVNEIYPDKTARCYNEVTHNKGLNPEELNKLQKLKAMAQGIEKRVPEKKRKNILGITKRE